VGHVYAHRVGGAHICILIHDLHVQPRQLHGGEHVCAHTHMDVEFAGLPSFFSQKLQHALPKRIEGFEMGVEGFRVGV